MPILVFLYVEESLVVSVKFDNLSQTHQNSTQSNAITRANFSAVVSKNQPHEATTTNCSMVPQKDPPKEVIVMNVQLPNRAAPGNVKAIWNAETKKIELYFQGKCGDSWEPITPAKDGVSTWTKRPDGMFECKGPYQDGDKWDTKDGSQVFWQNMEFSGPNAWKPQFNADGTPKTQYIDEKGRIHLPIAAQSGVHSGIDGPSLSFIVERDGSMTAQLLLEDDADASFNNKTAGDKLIIEGNSPPFHTIPNTEDPCNTQPAPIVPEAKNEAPAPVKKKRKTPSRNYSPPATTKKVAPAPKPHVDKPKPKPEPKHTPPPPPIAQPEPTPAPVAPDPVKKRPEPKGWTFITGSPSYTPQRAFELVSGNLPRSGHRFVKDAAELVKINPNALDKNGNFKPGVRINIDVKL